MSDPVVQSEPSSKVKLAIQIDAELLNQINHLTTDPSKVIEVAVRQWLRGGASRDDELTRSLQRNPPVPPRGEWNDSAALGQIVDGEQPSHRVQSPVRPRVQSPVRPSAES